MKILTTATLTWLNDGCCDVRYLDEWCNAPLSYTPGQPLDDTWHIDQYQEVIATDRQGKIFRRATDLLMHYRFYPTSLLSPVSDFSLQKRWLQVGDRIVQRIHLFNLFGYPLLDVISMNEISQVVSEPCRHGFTYITVDTHVEQGEWSAQVEWHTSGEIVLNIKSISRPRPSEPTRNHAFMRRLQKRAHQLGIQTFKQAVLA